jgi:ABC-2 type transport system permease protein
MLTLLQIEWLKVKKYKAFWIIFSFLLILFPSVTMGFGKMLSNLTGGNKGAEMLIGSPFDFNQVFYTAAYLNNGLNIAWGMLLILMIGNEFQNRTIRQNVIDGQQRNDVVTSKIILVVIFSFFSAILLMVSAMIAGLLFANNAFYFDAKILEVFGTFLFASFMQMMFALLFGFFVKRPALSVILYLGYTVFIENLLVLILVAIFKTSYVKLFFTQTADELTTVAITKQFAVEGAGVTPLAPEAPWIACVIYAGLIVFLLYRYINRTILK